LILNTLGRYANFKGFDFIKNIEQHCIYKKDSGCTVVFLVLFMDDILLNGNGISMMEAVKSSLRKSYSMKDLGEVAYILVIKIYRDTSKRLIGLSQDAYIDKVLNRFNMQDSKKCFLPMSHGITLIKKQCPTDPDEPERMRVIPYAPTIGSIMYAMICTRLDVSYALSATSIYQTNYGDTHWTIVKNILKYLRRTKEAFLVFGDEQELVVKGYNDSSFHTDAGDSKSQSSFMFYLNRGAVSWKSSKQDIVADSMVEAEYIAASEAAKDVVGIRNFVSELGVVLSGSSPMDLYCDNSGVIAQANEPRAHKRAKHVLRHYHLIHEIIGRCNVKIYKVHTDYNDVGLLMKPLPQPKHEAHLRSTDIRYLHE
jgi:hypothetical protein